MKRTLAKLLKFLSRRNIILMRISIVQESPPAWTQEAYRPPLSHSNFLLLRGGGGSLDKNFFSQSEHVSSQIWCQKFFPLLRPGTPPKNLRPGTPPESLRPGTPPKNLRPGTPPENLRPGTPPWKSETWDPPHLDLDLGPPPKVNRQTFPSINITFPRTTYAGGKNVTMWVVTCNEIVFHGHCKKHRVKKLHQNFTLVSKENVLTGEHDTNLYVF